MYAIILAGGVGTRLWPYSRQSRPKQFVDITGCGRTMLQSTVERLDGLSAADQIIIVTGQQYAQLAREQVRQIPPYHTFAEHQVIAEPCGRNTAPAIGLACIHLRSQGAQGVVAVLPADHTFQNVAQFQKALRRAEQTAQAGYLVMLGIEPHKPHTGYGYIKLGKTAVISGNDELPVYAVDHFLEKPDLATAQRFLADGGYCWNGGIFVSRIDRMLDEFARQMPELYYQLQQIEHALADPSKYAQALAEIWPQMPDISIDYGMIEGAKHVAAVPLRAGWNDVGSWDMLEQVLTSDETCNIQVRGDVLSLDSQRNVIFGEKRFMALVGVTDLVVVDTNDALLIGHKAQMQRVKDVVEHLRLQERAELL